MASEEGDDTAMRAIRPPNAPVARQIVASAAVECPNNASDVQERAAPQRVICNPISGEQIIIRTSGAETNGELLIFDLFLPPGKQVPSRHMHPIQEERFTILAGTMRFRLGWHRLLATPPDTVVVPPGVAHWFGNPGPEMMHARVEVRPALRMEAFLATAAEIEVGPAHSLHHRARQLPALARILLEFQHEVAVPDLAAWLVQPILAALARIGRRSATPATSGSTHDRS